ncbi:MAG: response regulator [Pelosinus sp.]|nr:response regulator [Pelosinus sp.]
MKKKLLLIEDDSFMKDMIALVLESEGYEVDSAESGREAMQRLNEYPQCAAVISDMYLPDSDAFTLFNKFSEAWPGLLFLILSSETDQAIVQKAADLGIAYIFKDENFAESIVAALHTDLAVGE